MNLGSQDAPLAGLVTLASQHDLDPDDLIPGYNGYGTFQDDPTLQYRLADALRAAPKWLRYRWGLPLRHKARRSRQCRRTSMLVVALYGDWDEHEDNVALYVGGTARMLTLKRHHTLAVYNAEHPFDFDSPNEEFDYTLIHEETAA